MITPIACALQSVVTGARSLAFVRSLLAIGKGGNWPAAVKAVAERVPAAARPLAVGIVNSGLTLLSVGADLFQVERTDLCLEMWGGHPGTLNRRFFLNGRGPYTIPSYGTEQGNCVYANPTIALETSHLVTGLNALQFACDRGTTFWGHFIVDQIAIRCYLKRSHPELSGLGLTEFEALVVTADSRKTLAPRTQLKTVIADRFLEQVESVAYFGRFEGYDDNGDAQDEDWHGYTHKRVFEHNLGRATTPPFEITWDTTMIPSQKGPMAVRALVKLRGGIGYWSPELSDLVFAEDRPVVQLFKCTDLPAPFWSRASRESKATLELPSTLDNLEKALLLVRIWDGGEGTVKECFTLNGHPYAVTSGKANHDLVFSLHEVPLEHLKPGANLFRVLSDTDHHGIEVLLPGPALILRFKRD